MKQKIKAIIFDMDGLMINSEPLHSKAYEIVLKEYGQTPVYGEHGLVYTPGIKGWPGIIGKYDIQEPYDILTQKKRVIFAELIKKVKPRPGLLRLVKLLKEKKYKLAIATSSIPQSADIVLKALRLEKIFDAVCATTNLQNPKPFPDVYLRAAKKLRVKSEECVVLEDSETGVTAAVAAGMKVIAIPSEYTKKQNFEAADYVLPSLNKVSLSLINSL